MFLIPIFGVDIWLAAKTTFEEAGLDEDGIIVEPEAAGACDGALVAVPQ